MDKLVSVIVPVYRSEIYLDKCVSSITAQTYRNLEIILVDDGSPDNSGKMCDSWAKKDSRIKVIHKTNGGLSSARNVGIDAAGGDYLGFVDSDDLIAPDLFEKVMGFFDSHEPEIVVFNSNRVKENGEIYAHTENIREGMLSGEEAVVELLRGNINNYAVNKVYKKEIFLGIRFPEGRLWEDMATTYKLFFKAKRIYCYPEGLYFYLTRADSISKNISEKALGHIFLARYEFHMAVAERLPSAVEYSLPLAALSARRLYDRSLWKEVDSETLALAKEFLEQNKETVLGTIKDRKYLLYYKFPRIYSLVRIIRHKIGTVVRRVSR